VEIEKNGYQHWYDTADGRIRKEEGSELYNPQPQSKVRKLAKIKP
jgi:hypothetical protein